MNTRPTYDPTKTIYTETSDDQGDLTAHILTNTDPLNATNAKPSIKCYFETFDEMHRMVKESYGDAAQYVDRTTFLAKMARRGMSSSLLEA